MVAAYLVAAGGAFVLVVVHVGGSEAYFGFDAPAVVENPVVAVAYAGTEEVALEAVVLQLVEQSEGELDVSGVEVAVDGVHADEVSAKGRTEPVAVLGLYPEVPPLLVVAECEWIP